MVKNLPVSIGDAGSIPGSGRSPGGGNVNPLQYSCLENSMARGFPGGSAVKNPPANAGNVGLIPGSRRSPGGGNGNPPQYSCLEKDMNRGAWQAIVPGVTDWAHDRGH